MIELGENEQIFLKNLSLVDPAIWRIKMRLLETEVNPDILLPIIDAVSYITNTTKHGDVKISIRNNIMYTVDSHITKTLEIDINS